MTDIGKNLALAAFTVGVAATQFATAQDNPFAMKQLAGGYLLAAAEGKCGEGKCGGEMKEQADSDKKHAEGKCGEGKCGGEMKEQADSDKKDAEGKCGEGKCGGAAK